MNRVRTIVTAALESNNLPITAAAAAKVEHGARDDLKHHAYSSLMQSEENGSFVKLKTWIETQQMSTVTKDLGDLEMTYFKLIVESMKESIGPETKEYDIDVLKELESSYFQILSKGLGNSVVGGA